MFLSKRKGIYYLWYTDSTGKRQKVSTRSTRKGDALAFIRSFLPKDPTPPAPLLSKFKEDFLAYARPMYSDASIELFERVFRDLTAVCGDRTLSCIDVRVVDFYKSQRLSRVSATTVNVELRALRAIFNKAMRWKLIASNLAMKNVDLYTIAKLLSHSNPNISTTLYAHISASHLHDAVEKLPETSPGRSQIQSSPLKSTPS